jgi:CubicO group peptidase (beta-lactamase class C family)
MRRPREVDNVRSIRLYSQMYTVLRALAIAPAVGAGLLLAGSAAAQRPQVRPPGPPVEQEGPAGPPTPVARRLDRADLEAWLDGYLPYALQRADVAGAVVVVVKDGGILLSKGYGYADVARRRPVDPQRTLFRPGSVSKLFTWTAVMQQVEQGKLDLDRDVNGYLDFEIPPAFGKPITLRNLMTHTPGFEEVNKNLILNDSTAIQPLDAFLKAWTPARIFPPGKVPAYSNYGTALAGYIVQRVSGESFDDYIDRHIFAPLGMEHATFRQPLPGRLDPDMAKGYDVASDSAKPFEVVIPAPAGSLSAAGEDMGRFMIAHLQNGRYGEAQILRPETARLMHETPLTIIPHLNRMVLGFYETNRNGRRSISHGGDTYVFHSDLHLFIDDDVGLFISMNSLGKDGAAGAIRTALFEHFADRYLPGDTPEDRVDPKTAMQHARLLAGIYDNSRRSASNFLSALNLLGPPKVTVNEDTTVSLSLLTGLSGDPKRWRETAPFVWREVNGKNWLAAKVDGGRVTMLSGDEISPFMMFLPAPWWRSPAWLTWLMLSSIVALLLTVVMWPVTALVRRHYKQAPALAGSDLRAHRWGRLAACAVVILLAAWSATVMTMVSDLSYLSSKLDPWLWVLQLLSLVAFVGAAGVALWHLRVVWTGKRRWPAKLWSAVLALACVTVLYVAFTFHLIGFSVNF